MDRAKASGGGSKFLSRRTITVWLIALGAFVAACFGPGQLVPKPAPQEVWRRLAGDHPLSELNVVLITVDTLRADHLACYGLRHVATPHLDALAAEGVRFADAATTVPFTLPAHSSIMTGTYPPFHGVRENVGYALDERIPTLAERLAAAGRATSGFVSAFVLDERWGIGRGFDHYFDDFDVASMKQINMGSVQRDGKQTIAEALRWLDRPDRPAEPFFLWLHLFDPHEPYEPPEPYRSRYPDHPYAAEVAYTDSLVGDFRRALEERDLLESSLLVLTGDHGEGLGHHRESFHGFFIYDSTVHIPLIVRVPFGDLGGRVVEQTVSHVDLLPTILEAVGATVPESAQGHSLLPLMLGMEEVHPEADGGDGWQRAVYSESYYSLFHYGWAPLRSIRAGGYKYIDTPEPELYRPADDPREERNLFRHQRRTARDLKQRLEALTASLDPPSAERRQQPDLDQETLEQLRALGYVAGRGEVAEESEREVPRADPKDKIEVHQSIMWAQTFIGKGNDEAAVERLEEALERDPGMIDAHQMLGSIATRQRRWDEAAERFRQALALDPDHRTSLFGLAGAYRRMGRLEEALVGFKRLQSLAPHDSKAARAMVEIHVDRGELAAALAAVDDAAQAPAAPALVHNQHGELLALMGRPEEAVIELERAIATGPRLAQPHFNLAVLHERRGEIEPAIERYAQTLKRAPKHFQAQFNLGRLHGDRGELDRQQALWEAAIESNPDFVAGYYYLAKLLMDRAATGRAATGRVATGRAATGRGGDLERAEDLTRQGLARDPEHRGGPLGYFVLADLLNRTGRHAEALSAVEQGRRIQAREQAARDPGSP